MSNGKWKCSNCGTENAGDDNFCGECGGKKPESSGWKCPNCGKQKITSNFCPDCGTKKPEAKKMLAPEEMEQIIEKEIKLRKKLAESLRKNGLVPIKTTFVIPCSKILPDELFSIEPENITKGRIVMLRGWICRVLDVDMSDNTALLVSEYGLKEMRFDAASNNWATSEIRKWLNETFYNRFTPEEQARIISRPNGDKVFLLCKEDVEYFFSGDSERICYLYNKDYAVCWWLRSPGTDPNCAMYVDHSGAVCESRLVNLANCYVRPAILVKF